ncbi:MAG: hypothetical protein HQM08_03945 [Candidatus Riflebacteria bacterium]|nr:hypothetical protein [Candidatus Riflebacteria bacterium]
MHPVFLIVIFFGSIFGAEIVSQHEKKEKASGDEFEYWAWVIAIGFLLYAFGLIFCLV